MINNNIKRMFLFLTLLVLLISVVNAAEVSNDTDSEITYEKVVQQEKTLVNTFAGNVVEEQNIKLNKNTHNNTLKSSSKTYDVNYFKPLRNMLINDEYDDVTININSDIKIIESINISESIKHLTINGNNKSVNGYKYSFLNISNKSCVTINNLNINNFSPVYPIMEYGAILNWGNLTLVNVNVSSSGSPNGAAITNFGELTVYNSIFDDNHFHEIECSGGAIANYGNMDINNTIFINNNVLWSGGAIGNYGNMTINNSEFYNNSANVFFGGAICNYGDMSIYNSILNDNDVKYSTEYYERWGGAIYTHKSLFIDNSTFNNNIAKYGGAIYNDGKLIISNSNFENNKALKSGAIQNTNFSVISDSTFKKNVANGSGGVTFSNGELKITNSQFIDNYAKGYGGVFSTNNNIIIKNNLFENNTAGGAGGAIEIYGKNNKSHQITGNTFIKNTAKNGSAIYNNATLMNINENKFIQNKLNNSSLKTNNALLNSTAVTLKNNKNFTNTQYPGQVQTIKESTLINNIVNDNLTETKLTINKLNTTQYKDKIILKGKLTDNKGEIIANNQLILKINDKTATIKTNNDGTYTYTHKTYKIGKNNITISYTGNDTYRTSNVKSTFTVTKRTTKISVDKITTKTYKENIIITGKLTDKSGTILKNRAVKVNYNGKTKTTKTNSNGIYTTKFTTSRVGSNTVTVSYSGNNYYKTINAKTTFKSIARATKITINKITKIRKGKIIKITGKLTDNQGIGLNANVKIKINTKTVKIKTNSKGVYTYNYKTTTRGTNNLSITFIGTNNYKATTTKTTFKVI